MVVNKKNFINVEILFSFCTLNTPNNKFTLSSQANQEVSKLLEMSAIDIFQFTV